MQMKQQGHLQHDSGEIVRRASCMYNMFTAGNEEMYSTGARFIR